MVYWGRQILGVKADANENQKLYFERITMKRFYSSFILKGVIYRPRDIVYLNAPEGPPYIATILSLMEDQKTKKKSMRVRWFLRPCELTEGLADVDYRQKCNEVFVQWGIGAHSLVDPASTIRKCNVVCIAEEDWNSVRPTSHQIAAADHVFKRAYDATARKLEPLEVIIRRYGVEYVTLVGKPISLPTTDYGEFKDEPIFGTFDDVGLPFTDDLGTPNPWSESVRSRGHSHFEDVASSSKVAGQIPVPTGTFQNSEREAKGLRFWNAGSQHDSQSRRPDVELLYTERDGKDLKVAEEIMWSKSAHLRRRSAAVLLRKWTSVAPSAERSEQSRPRGLRRRSAAVLLHKWNLGTPSGTRRKLG